MSNGYREAAENIARAMEDKKAGEVVILDVSGMTLVTDYLVIGSGNTAIQVRAIADGIQEKMGKTGLRPLHKEGYENGRWILLDFGGVVAHVLNHVDREFYNLERLWGQPARSDEARPLAPTSRITRV